MQKILELDVTKDFLSKIDENAYDILSKWNKVKDLTNDEKISAVIGQKITVVRSVLNKLCFRGIVKYSKEKDQKSGWYNFYWSIDFKKLALLISQEHLERKAKLKEKLKEFNEHDYFSCKNNCNEVPFEIAAEYNFICPQCNQSLVLIDKKTQSLKYAKEIKKIEKDLEFIKTLFK